jgi:hypothetical protein
MDFGDDCSKIWLDGYYWEYRRHYGDDGPLWSNSKGVILKILLSAAIIASQVYITHSPVNFLSSVSTES